MTTNQISTVSRLEDKGWERDGTTTDRTGTTYIHMILRRGPAFSKLMIGPDGTDRDEVTHTPEVQTALDTADRRRSAAIARGEKVTD